MAKNNLMPVEFTAEEIQLEANHQEFLNKHDKENEIDPINALALALRVERIEKHQDAAFYRNITVLCDLGHFEIYDSNNTYLCSFDYSNRTSMADWITSFKICNLMKTI